MVLYIICILVNYLIFSLVYYNGLSYDCFYINRFAILSGFIIFIIGEGDEEVNDR